MNYEIIPAVMPRNLDDIESAARSVKDFSRIIQIDIMDGKYVPEPTWPYLSGGGRDIDSFTKGEIGLPLWEEVDYELDLMVTRPEENLDIWMGMGASRIIFHQASVHDWSTIAEIDATVRNFVSLGVAVTLHDDMNVLDQLIKDHVVDFVQCMGIEQIGYQGEPFNPDILGFIAGLHSRYPDLVISIDGGVSEQTIERLAEAGISQFVSGSAVFGQGIPEENINNLKNLLKT